MLQKMKFMVDVESAEAAVDADRVRILADIAAESGGYAALNSKIDFRIVIKRY